MDNDECKQMEADLRKAATRAFRKVMKSLENEPSVILMSDNEDSGTECPINEITSWLFRRRQGDGGKGN